MSKKRILIDNEASFLATGYANYGRELISRLHASNQYEIFELGSYSTTEDSYRHNLPWEFMGNQPHPQDEVGQKEYGANLFNQFGAFKFEEACLKFKPTHVLNFRDDWMYSHNIISPFRDMYQLLLMPTVDSAPQDEPWIANIIEADGILAYNDWGLQILDEQCGGLARIYRAAPPGVDPVLSPIEDKVGHKKLCGLPADSFIIGTVMRNQKRKLFPDLIKSYSDFLAKAPKDIADKTFFYFHTTYPDIGWDLPRLLKEAGIASRSIFTYKCNSCQRPFNSVFQDARSVCGFCGAYTAQVISTRNGVSREILGDIINCFDIYVQYANAEGFGIPILEAASCGIPIVGVDYSAMSDVVRKLKGELVTPGKFVREPETHRNFAVPNNNELVDILLRFSQMPLSLQRKKGHDTRKAAEIHYSWDKTVETWIEAIESPKEQKLSWNHPPRYFESKKQFPQHISNEQLVHWGIDNVLGLPRMKNSYLALRLIRDLNNGASCTPASNYQNEMTIVTQDIKYQDFTYEQVLNILYNMRLKYNYWETHRTKN